MTPRHSRTSRVPGFKRDRRRGFNRAAAQRVGASSLQLPCGGRGEAAIRPLLKLVTDPSGQELAGEPHRRRHPVNPPPLPAQLEDGHLREPHERLCDIDRPFFHVTDRAALRCGNGERPRWASRMLAKSRASFSPCPPGTRARCAAASRSPASFLRCWPLRIGSAVSSRRSCLVTCSTFGSSAFNGVLAAATRSAFDLNRSRRFLGVGSRRRDLTPGCRLRLGAPLLRCGALRVPGFYGKGRHGVGSVGSRRRN